ncbi:hypothetical protein [Lederbergia graminis]
MKITKHQAKKIKQKVLLKGNGDIHLAKEIIKEVTGHEKVTTDTATLIISAIQQPEKYSNTAERYGIEFE